MPKIFLPKDADGRKKEVKKLHIMGLILMALMMVALWGAMGILIRALIKVFYGDIISDLMGSMRLMSSDLGFYGAFTYDPTNSPIVIFLRFWEIASYVITILALGGAVYMLWRMRKQSKIIVDDITAFDEKITVKKSKYVWLCFLLGGYGAHLFLIGKKKRGYIFLGLGLAGLINPVTFLYTSGISFADAFLACFYPKDCDGMVDLEYYPYWL
ncbi:MAG: hypothetical protein IKI20_01735 [Lachnospiraceae bacterium]|nr:hypothetical protein [Lachnospiraceae bacterium]